MFGATQASAYEVKRTPTGNVVRWDNNNVTLRVSESVSELPGGRESLEMTFSAWSGQEGAPHLGGQNEGAAAEPGYDKVNTVFFMPKSYEPAGRALAITILTYDNKSGAILDADIVVNGKYTFALLDESAPHAAAHASGKEDVYDILHVLAHESGHALGLSDEIDQSDVLMYRYSSPNDASMRVPTSDDKAGLAEIYSRAVVPQEESGGCGDSSVSPSRPQKMASHLALAFGVGFVTFMVARRRRKGGGAGVASAASLATFALTLLPTMERASHAQGVDAEEASSHATASVIRAQSRLEHGMIRTNATLRVDSCRVASCPSTVEHRAWGGTVGSVTQVFGHEGAPEADTKVHLTFQHPVSVWEKMKPGFVPGSPGHIESMHRARAAKSE